MNHFFIDWSLSNSVQLKFTIGIHNFFFNESRSKINLAKDEKTFFPKRREVVGQEQCVLVLGARHHVQELVARGPDVLRNKRLNHEAA